ncbi:MULTISPECIES: RDD family protein [Gordonia]|uniref:RDD family protein n=1 Tax=Gordonia TaxID=2053 RepID=UPI0025B8ED59|nr:RDD family protein [Gordonia sp. UBA5067]
MSRPVPGPYRAAVPRPPLRPLPPPVSPSHSGTRGVGRDDFVSGEAVALDLPSANLGLRVLSGLIDVTLGWALFWLWFLYLMPQISKVVQLDSAFRAGLGTAWTVLVFLALPTVVETLTRGKTLGHLVLGLRTVNDDAGPITIRQAFGRALLGMPELYFFAGVPALVTAAVNPKSKRLGDLVSGTYVIRDRSVAPPARLVFMPPELAQWAASADLAPMPPSLASGIRGYLDRYCDFTPQAQAINGQQLLVRALGFVAPPPPPTAAPRDVLAAIAAERYRRDAERIARNQKLQAALFTPSR